MTISSTYQFKFPRNLEQQIEEQKVKIVKSKFKSKKRNKKKHSNNVVSKENKKKNIK